MIFRFEFVERFLAADGEAAELLKPAQLAPVRRYRSRRREEDRTAWGTFLIDRVARTERNAANEPAREHRGRMEAPRVRPGEDRRSRRA